jgi:hypothetical protein
VRPAVVFCDDFHVLVKFAAIELVLDPEVRDVHVAVEVGQVVFACPFLDLVRVAVGASIAVRAVAIALLEELLILAPQVAFEDDATDGGVTRVGDGESSYTLVVFDTGHYAAMR